MTLMPASWQVCSFQPETKWQIKEDKPITQIAFQGFSAVAELQ